MRRRTTRSLLAVSLVGVLTLAACGSDNTSSDATAAPGTAARGHDRGTGRHDGTAATDAPATDAARHDGSGWRKPARWPASARPQS